jgi:hypothetical protein
MGQTRSPPHLVGSALDINQYKMPPNSAPPPKAEDIPSPPDSFCIWIEGSWEWQGRWVWESGHWATPPYPAANWVKGKWSEKVPAPLRVWINGHWN